MAVTTCFQRPLVRSGVYSPFNRRLTRKPQRVINNKQPTVKRPERAIRIGDHINPYTGEIIPGQAYLPLSTNRGVRIAFGIFGESGSGKCIVGSSIVILPTEKTTLERLYSINTSIEVLSYNQEKFCPEFKRVSNITRRRLEPNEKIYKLTVSGNYSLTLTGNHRIILDDFSEKNVSELNIGEFLVVLDDKKRITFISIKKIEIIFEYNDYVYDLEIEDNHNFFTGNDKNHPILVHNSITLRDIVEYFAYEEGRSVIVFDDTKNQYWSFKYKQDRLKMLDKLKSLNIEPIEIPETTVYSPAYDEPVLGFKTMQQFKHVDKLLSIKTSALTVASFFELGNIDPSGRMYYNKLMEILNVPAKERTIEYINSQLDAGMSDPTMKKSISSLKNIFNPLCNMGIIRDDGTDVNEMLHPPRKGKPGKVSVINLSTSVADDCRKSAVVATICQQIFDICRQNAENGIFFEPIVVLDEAKAYIGKQASLATRNGFSLLHLQGRAWGIIPVFGFQLQSDICEWIFGGNTNYLIEMKKSFPLLDGGRDENNRMTQPTVLSGSGFAHIFINGSGDENIPDMDMYVKVLPCRTRHVD